MTRPKKLAAIVLSGNIKKQRAKKSAHNVLQNKPPKKLVAKGNLIVYVSKSPPERRPAL